jgi:hypothetical protein
LAEQDGEPAEVIITGVEIPTVDLVWLVAKIVIVVVAVSIPIYLICLAVFLLLAILLSLL